MSTFLVTGGAGFIGSHVCTRLLAQGDRVVAVDDLSTGRISNLAEARTYGAAFTFQNLDIRTEEVRSVFDHYRPEVVVHMAAQSGVRPGIRDPVLDASINVIGLLRVLESAAASGTRKVLYAASGGTLYGRPRRLPVKERSRRGSRPENPYAITKKVAEDYLAYYRRVHGLDYTILAMANVYGPRQDPHGEAGVVAIFGRRMLAGEQPTIFGTGEQTRDYVFVDDAVHAFALAASRGSGKVVNIATGVQTSVLRIYELLAGATGYGEGPAFGPSPGDDLPAIALDVSAAKEVFGWSPWTSIEDGIRQTVEYLRRE